MQSSFSSFWGASAPEGVRCANMEAFGFAMSFFLSSLALVERAQLAFGPVEAEATPGGFRNGSQNLRHGKQIHRELVSVVFVAATAVTLSPFFSACFASLFQAPRKQKRKLQIRTAKNS